jgi:hypothetical protein
VALVAFSITLGLHACNAADIAFISDEPVFLGLAFAANQSGRLSDQGLVGSFGVVYSPVAVWFYQLLLAVTSDMIALATLKIAIVSTALAFAMWKTCTVTKLSPWPLFLIAASPFVALYQRMLWDNVLLIPLSAGMVAATASFLATPTVWRLWIFGGLCAFAFHVHILAVVPIAACGVAILVFHAGWFRSHVRAVALSAVAAVAVISPFLYAIALEQGPTARPRPSMTRALLGVWHGCLFWSHEGFETFLQSFYRDSALLHALQIGTGGVATVAAGAAFVAFVLGATRRRVPLAAWPLKDRLALLATLMVLAGAALFVGLRLEPYWHYANSGWFGSFYLIWWGFDRARDRWWAKALLAGQAIAVGAMTALLAMHIHTHHGDRSLQYGATLGNQMEVARQIVERKISGVVIAVDNYARYPQGLEFLVYTRARQTGTDMKSGTGRAKIRYATTSVDDGRIEVVFDDGPGK